MQSKIVKETFQLVSKRSDDVCNFLESGRLTIVARTPYKYNDMLVSSAARTTNSSIGIMRRSISCFVSIPARVNWEY